MHYDKEREEEQQACFSCDKEFNADDNNDRDHGWFCDDCLNQQHNRG